MIEVGTILISTIFTHILSACMLFFLWRKNRFDGISYWANLFSLQAVGITLLLMSKILPLFVSVIIGNFLVVVSMHFLLVGICRFFNTPVPKKYTLSIVVACSLFVVLYLYFTYFQYSLKFRIVTSSTLQAFVLSLCVLFITKNHSEIPYKKVSTIKWILLCIIAFMLARSIGTVFLGNEMNLFVSHVPTSIFLLFNQMLSLFLAVQLVLLVNNRLFDDVKKAHCDIAASEEKYRELVENSPSGICILDDNFSIKYANNKLSKILRYAVHDIKGADFRKFIAKESVDMVSDVYRKRQQSNVDVPSVYEAQAIDADGKSITLEMYGAVLKKQGSKRFTLAQIIDITERKKTLKELDHYRAHLEELVTKRTQELVQAEKMSSLGCVSAGLAHEINNPNNYIRLNSEQLLKGLSVLKKNIDACCIPENLQVDSISLLDFIDEAPEIAHDIIDGSLRVNTIISSLKEFASPSENIDPKVIDLNDSVKKAVLLAGKYVSEHSDVFEQFLHPEPLFICGDATKIEHIIINLLQNSSNALSSKKQKIQISTKIIDGNYGIIVFDEGCGIPHENLSRIFDPFFTTRRENGGTGLGLSVVKRLVEEMNGTIDVTSVIAVGTTFKVFFPAVPNSQPDSK